MIELTVLNDSNVELNTVDDGLIGLDVVMATGGGSEIHNQDKTVTPTESEQSVTADVGYTGLGTVTVEGIDSEYVGSDIPRNTSSSLLTEGATVIAPSGYYENSATKTVQMGTAGTPTASKGAVSNHSVSVTPSVTNQAGYIYSETKTGTAVSVSASELVSGTKSISANGTEDVTNYASVSVSVPNSYSASDEGKVVNNGALVSQTSDTVTANDTYDTTLINSLTVNVSGGGSTEYGKPYTLAMGGANYFAVQDNYFLFHDTTNQLTRRSIWSWSGVKNPNIFISNSNYSTLDTVYPIEIPSNSTNISVSTERTAQIYFIFFSYDGSKYQLIDVPGYLNAPVQNYTIPSGSQYVAMMYRINASNASINYANESRWVKIEFS